MYFRVGQRAVFKWFFGVKYEILIVKYEILIVKYEILIVKYELTHLFIVDNLI
jgi:hypothetical protein